MKYKAGEWYYTPLSKDYLESWTYIKRITGSGIDTFTLIVEHDGTPTALIVDHEFIPSPVVQDLENEERDLTANSLKLRYLIENIFRLKLIDERD